MRIVFIKLLIIGAFFCTACVTRPSSEPTINLEIGLGRLWNIHDLCKDVDVIPIKCSIGDSFKPSSPVVMDISNDYILLLDDNRDKIFVFDQTGDYVHHIVLPQTAMDFSIYQDTVLSVLLGGNVLEYSLKSFNCLSEFHFPDNGVNLRALMRRDENVLLLSGSADGRGYDCEFFVDKNKFISMLNPVNEEMDIQENRFFRYADSTFYYYATSGMVLYYTVDDFIIPLYEWRFKTRGKKQTSEVAFKNVQRSSTYLYLAIERDGEECIIVYRISDGRYKVIKQMRGGIKFPLGIIRDDVNYSYSSASSLSNYLDNTFLEKVEPTLRTLKAESPVVVKYALDTR